ncbi:response regulator [Aminobacter sp. AP02]|uniref:response regulator transcription factor n=1 Tax=Aminobacter sp. AP02 TaxID=2135737 RepID=UPI000D792F11|nr:response regulator [Aminobacter sp. AP02]PWK65648.1 response regulator receiver domain-containing protein [Aminobacter sp. AP02]
MSKMGIAPIVVAIVDDDGAVRRALRRLVLSLSYQSVGYASGEEFLASLLDMVPSCVILDQHMPNLNGLDVLGRMRSEGLAMPVIIITGLDQPGMRAKCIKAGAAAYLVKPLESSVLSTVIEAAIAG